MAKFKLPEGAFKQSVLAGTFAALAGGMYGAIKGWNEPDVNISSIKQAPGGVPPSDLEKHFDDQTVLDEQKDKNRKPPKLGHATPAAEVLGVSSTASGAARNQATQEEAEKDNRQRQQPLPGTGDATGDYIPSWFGSRHAYVIARDAAIAAAGAVGMVLLGRKMTGAGVRETAKKYEQASRDGVARALDERGIVASKPRSADVAEPPKGGVNVRPPPVGESGILGGDLNGVGQKPPIATAADYATKGAVAEGLVDTSQLAVAQKNAAELAAKLRQEGAVTPPPASVPPPASPRGKDMPAP